MESVFNLGLRKLGQRHAGDRHFYLFKPLTIMEPWLFLVSPEPPCTVEKRLGVPTFKLHEKQEKNEQAGKFPAAFLLLDITFFHFLDSKEPELVRPFYPHEPILF